MSYFLGATLPLKPATIALKIGHQRLSRGIYVVEVFKVHGILDTVPPMDPSCATNGSLFIFRSVGNFQFHWIEQGSNVSISKKGG